MRCLRSFIAALCAVAALCQPALASRYAYLPQADTNTVAVVDTQENTVVVANIPVGATPSAVATHPAGHLVYVANLASNDVSVIETAGNTVVTTIPVGAGPYHLAVSPDGGEVYVPNYNEGTLSVISTASNSVVATLLDMPNANAVAFSPSGATAYVNDFNGGGIYVIDTATRTGQRYVVPTGAEGMAVHPSGRYVYLSDTSSDVVTVFDTTTNTYVTTSMGATGGWGVAVHPDGRYYYVAVDSGFVAVFRASDNGLVTLVPTPASSIPAGISLTPSGDFAYIADRGANGLAYVLNTTTHGIDTIISGLNTGMTAMGTAIQRPLFGHGAIAAGQYHTCRIRSDQSIDCWGRNDSQQADAPPGAFTQVVAGSAHTCALGVDGAVSCWGDNTYGQRNVPAGQSFQRITSGARHACGIVATGEAICWGQASQGQALAPTGPSFQHVAAGSSHSCAVTGVGDLMCWGRGAEGQLLVPPGSFVRVVTGAAFSCALAQDRSVACWGDATGGKLSVPPGLFAAIYAQSERACGLRYDGSLECWGANGYGEGNAPPLVHADVAMGRLHTCSLQALGVARCWGQSLYNQAPQFALDASVPAGATVNSAIVPIAITMVVSNPGLKTPYAPRSPVYAVVSGTLPPGLSLSSDGVLSGQPASPGSFTFGVEAEELNGFTAARDFTITVGANDSTPPVITPTVTGLPGTNGWYRGNVVVSWSVVDGESAVDYTSGCGTVVISTDTPGAGVICEAGSAGGLRSQSVLIRLDKTAPTGVPVLSNNRPLLHEPISVVANGLDATSGVASEVCDATPTDTVSLAGARAYCLVTDVAGNSSRRPFAYRVVYGFQGFTGTVRNPGYWNAAGLSQPITFHYRVVDFNGTPVTGLASAFMGGATLACPAKTANTAPVSLAPDGVVEIGDGRYEFTWTSLSSPACVRLFLGLGDGNTNNRALFKFE